MEKIIEEINKEIREYVVNYVPMMTKEILKISNYMLASIDVNLRETHDSFEYQNDTIDILLFHIFKQKKVLDDGVDWNSPNSVINRKKEPLVPISVYAGFDIKEALLIYPVRIDSYFIDLIKKELTNRSSKTEEIKPILDINDVEDGYFLINPFENIDEYDIDKKQCLIFEKNNKHYFLQKLGFASRIHNYNLDNICINEHEFGVQQYFSSVRKQ